MSNIINEENLDLNSVNIELKKDKKALKRAMRKVGHRAHIKLYLHILHGKIFTENNTGNSHGSSGVPYSNKAYRWGKAVEAQYRIERVKLYNPKLSDKAIRTLLALSEEPVAPHLIFWQDILHNGGFQDQKILENHTAPLLHQITFNGWWIKLGWLYGEGYMPGSKEFKIIWA
jgi:hypothetical protein